MEAKELAHRLMEIDGNIDKFQEQLSEIGIDTGNSVLQFIDIPRLVGEILGVPKEDLDMVDESRVFLDGTKESADYFIDNICDYVEEYVNKEGATPCKEAACFFANPSKASRCDKHDDISKCPMLANRREFERVGNNPTPLAPTMPQDGRTGRGRHRTTRERVDGSEDEYGSENGEGRK